MFTTGNAVIVLDGASQPEPTPRDGGWLADAVGSRLHLGLTAAPDADLGHLLERSIGDVVAEHGLIPGRGPSATVAMVRWLDETLDVLVLGDSPVVLLTADRGVVEIRDDRLAAVAIAERAALRRAAPGKDRTLAWAALVEAQRRLRNTPAGYWIVEALPGAARQAVRATFDPASVSAVLAMTDGVANGVHRYGVPSDWMSAVRIAAADPAALVDLVHETEAGDPTCARWPRSKPHDDKALAVVCLQPVPPRR